MLYNDHFDEVKERMMGYWNREAMERCSASVMIAKAEGADAWGSNYYFDITEADRRTRERLAKWDYEWESIPFYFPYFGTAGIAEYAGCIPNYTPRTTWFAPCLDEPDASGISFTNRESFKRQNNAIKELLGLAKNDYVVTVTDNCGIADALAAMRGTENLLMDMITEEDFVTDAIEKLIPIYKETQNTFFETVEENNEGSVLSWMHLWAPKRCAQLQCDLSVMISPELFKKFIMPELEELTAFLDYPVYHFDGQEQRRHLDMLLSLPKLRAIQWTPVAGQPPTSAYISELQMIQKAGKNLILFPQSKEIEFLLDNLSSRGLHLVTYAYSKEEGEYIIKTIKEHSVVRD